MPRRGVPARAGVKHPRSEIRINQLHEGCDAFGFLNSNFFYFEEIMLSFEP